jgi:hypothetical protein
MEDRRRHKRIARCFMAWLKFRQAKKPIYPVGWDIVTTHDLGAGGLLFNYDHYIEIGATIEFKIVLPNSRTQLKCIGEVVRNQKINSSKHSQVYRVAAEFKIVDSNSRDLIRELSDNRFCA